MAAQNQLKNVLNQEFNAYVREFKQLLPKLNESDKKIAVAWVSKLTNCTSNMANLKQRNIVINSLLFQMTNGALLPPFNDKPTFTNIMSLGPFPDLDKEKVLTEADTRLPRILQQSPDQGAFLLTQPIPKCGAFCYLAVVSKPAQE